MLDILDSWDDWKISAESGRDRVDFTVEHIEKDKSKQTLYFSMSSTEATDFAKKVVEKVEKRRKPSQ